MTNEQLEEALKHDAEVPRAVRQGESYLAAAALVAGEPMTPRAYAAQLARSVSVRALQALQKHLTEAVPPDAALMSHLMGVADRADMLADKLELGAQVRWLKA